MVNKLTKNTNIVSSKFENVLEVADILKKLTTMSETDFKKFVTSTKNNYMALQLYEELTQNKF